MRNLWKGTISFGLVTIPVKLYAATEDRDVKFRSLHAICKTPIRYVKMCPTCQREVALDQIARGYEYEPGHFVEMDESDFGDLPAAAARTVEILEFVQLAQIDPIYFERTYYLEPGEGGAKAYDLLRRALLESGQIAIARVAIRAKSAIATVRVYGGHVLVMETMHFPDEVRPWSALDIPAASAVREQELAMAKSLIAMLAADFRPERYVDEYRDQLLERIQQKVAGAEVVQAPAPAAAGRMVDLMEALRASIQAAQTAQGRPAPQMAPPTQPAGAWPGPAPSPPH